MKSRWKHILSNSLFGSFCLPSNNPHAIHRGARWSRNEEHDLNFFFVFMCGYVRVMCVWLCGVRVGVSSNLHDANVTMKYLQRKRSVPTWMSSSVLVEPETDPSSCFPTTRRTSFVRSLTGNHVYISRLLTFATLRVWTNVEYIKDLSALHENPRFSSSKMIS